MAKNITKPRANEEDLYWRPVNNDAGIRRCLACEKEFESEGRHNRLCPKCRKIS